MSFDDVVWHDVECGRYDADLQLWEDLAAGAEHGVLDVGAGTGRVSLPLALAGHRVTALDIDGELLETLRDRADDAGVEVATITADANDFTLPAPVSLVAVPMQTIQLLPDRDGFFASARRALVPGGGSRSRSPPTSSRTTAPRPSPPRTRARPGAGRTSRSRSRSGSTATWCRSNASAR